MLLFKKVFKGTFFHKKKQQTQKRMLLTYIFYNSTIQSSFSHFSFEMTTTTRTICNKLLINKIRYTKLMIKIQNASFLD